MLVPIVVAVPIGNVYRRDLVQKDHSLLINGEHMLLFDLYTFDKYQLCETVFF